LKYVIVDDDEWWEDVNVEGAQNTIETMATIPNPRLMKQLDNVRAQDGLVPIHGEAAVPGRDIERRTR
jgi:hypothetical protein